ncbi:MAG: adenylate/guanylate cyclase domain-containing protein [Burkholderiaceae bacterium]|nr:adenylate/guanylate cyclase domain-containing protein [Burkholderiaceae bacterium]
MTEALKTVVFADIVGSTSLYETLGNERAALAVTELLNWMTAKVQQRRGRVVKTLGDGLLCLFPESSAAVRCTLEIMREHRDHILWPTRNLGPALRMGLDSGEVLDVAGDCYGDAVNTASRLCDRSAPGEIWATEAVAMAGADLPNAHLVRLGHMSVKGKAEPVLMYQIEWRTDESPEPMTQHAGLTDLGALDSMGAVQIQFAWGRTRHVFDSTDAPVQVGRSSEAHMHIDDPRVSRFHVRIDWRDGSFVLTDMSSFGTWVMFEGNDAPVQLRRDSCILHGSGQFSLSLPFTAPDAPRVSFQITGQSMSIGR